MQVIKCEMCGGIDFVKKNGFFVCQHCRTQYTVENAKKMMIDGTVRVDGVVKVDNSDELSNLYQLARRAKEDNNSTNAEKYYSQIIVKDPASWEAYFYIVYYQAVNSKISEIQQTAIKLTNCESTVLKLVKDNITSIEQQKEAVNEVVTKLWNISVNLYKSAENFYCGIYPLTTRIDYKGQFLCRCNAITNILYNLGDNIISIFGDDFGKISADSWEIGIQIHIKILKYYHLADERESNVNIIKKYEDRIKKYNPEYQSLLPEGGCYIATCVYGSYDCPQVWTLRRYRDNTLASSWYGRLFIKIYYTFSPTVVRLFGKTKWFNKIWRTRLDL